MVKIHQGFPSPNYKKIHSIMCNQKQKYPKSVNEFSAAWKAVIYRFSTCNESNEGFTESFKKVGEASERYIQEKYLFHFFVNGYSALESFGYALYMIASTVKPSFFPIKPSNIEKIYISTTFDKFNSKKVGFYHERITDELNQLHESSEFEKWRPTRHALIHRIAPGRRFHLQSRGIKKK